MITGVIFDLDDTLYDEIDFCRAGFRAAASRMAALSDAYSAEAVFATLCKCFLTGARGLTFNLAQAELGIPGDGPLIRKLVAVYRTHTPTPTLPPESRAVLENLKDRYTLDLLTDGYLLTWKLRVQTLGIETKDFIVPNWLGLLTVRLLRPSGLYRQPSSRTDAAPRVKIAAIGEWAGLLARFAERT